MQAISMAVRKGPSLWLLSRIFDLHYAKIGKSSDFITKVLV